MSNSRVEQLWEASHTVLQDCALPNGAIVAANTDLPEYPPTAENYRFVWPRDAAFHLVAAQILDSPGVADRRSNFIQWLNNAEEFTETGLLIKRYGTNGVLDLRYGSDYQPDQAGAMLWALHETQTSPDPQADELMRRLADGLSSVWQGTHFKTATQDLWENRSTNPADGDVFTYSAAACAHGLHLAAKQWEGRTPETDKWAQTANEMQAVLAFDDGKPHYTRKIFTDGREDPGDDTLDSSLNALIYPFYNADSAADRATLPKRERTVLEINKVLYAAPRGTSRCLLDTYDSIVRPDGREFKGGRWPLLTFWDALALHRTGHPDEAKAVYFDLVDYLDELYKKRTLPNNRLPEQIYDKPKLNEPDRDGKGVVPLAWSHAMFVITTRELGIL